MCCDQYSDPLVKAQFYQSLLAIHMLLWNHERITGNFQSAAKKKCILYEEEPRFDQASWIDNSHVFDYEAFVPNYRNGLCGPVVSFWARVNDNNSWFAAPK